MGDSETLAVFGCLVEETSFAVAQELQQQVRSGTNCQHCKHCHVQADAAVPTTDPEAMALRLEGVVVRSPMLCSCRRDLVEDSRYDCFGQPRSATGANDTIVCPHCGSKTAAGRFASHLQRCMGGGRSTANNRATTRQSRASTPLQQQHSGHIGESGGPRGSVSRERDEAHGFSTGPPTKRSSTDFCRGAAAAKLEKTLRDKSRGQSPNDRTTVATAKHAKYLAIASAAVRGQS